MKPYQHFGLVRPPFEVSPDPRVFYGSSFHGEALATLEYTVHADKNCTIVMGESGSGKTLLARLIAAKAGKQAGVVWVHGLGQPAGVTELSVFPPGALSAPVPEPAAEHTTLARWMRVRHRSLRTPLLIIDDADDLPDHSWHDVVSLLSREVQFAQPINLVIFAAPPFVKRLGSPELTRLRRRVFRTCVLGRLSKQQVRAYVNCRLAAAGSSDPDLFSIDATDQVHRLTKGNPGLVNQVGENALLEAFTHERKRVIEIDVIAAARAIVGGLYILPPGTGSGVSLRRPPDLEALPEEPTDTIDAEPPAVHVSDAVAPNLDDRLARLESRLALAMSTVRRVRSTSVTVSERTTPPTDSPESAPAEGEPVAAT